MLLIREIFIAKPGHAGELAKMMKGAMKKPDASGNLPVVLLDFVTDYNTIVVEGYFKNMADFERMMTEDREKMKSEPPPKGPKYTDLYLTGKREVFKVVE